MQVMGDELEAGDEGSEEVGRSRTGPWLHVHVSPDTRKERGRRVGGVAGMSSIRGRGTDSPISFPRARSASMAKCTIFAQGEPKAQEDGWVLMYSFTDPRARFATSCRKRQPQGRAMDLLGPPCALQTRCTSIVGRPSIAGGLRGRGSSSSRAEAAPPLPPHLPHHFREEPPLGPAVPRGSRLRAPHRSERERVLSVSAWQLKGDTWGLLFNPFPLDERKGFSCELLPEIIPYGKM